LSTWHDPRRSGFEPKVRERALANLQSDWDLDGVRTDPRYLDLLKRMGLDKTTHLRENLQVVAFAVPSLKFACSMAR